MNFWELGVSSIKELESEHGILASSRQEIYGCIFGRDSLITSMLLLRAHERRNDPYFLYLVEKILRNLALLQGKEVNLESGEEPGKCIHEWRPTGHEHLTSMTDSPWYLYPDNVMRNYDTVDATPLYLMTVYEYWRASKNDAFVEAMLPSINAALQWLLTRGDANGDGLIDYTFHPDRKYGGLRTQSWMDSTESVFFEHESEKPAYPIAPLEVQAYAFAALRSWSDYYATRDMIYASTLAERAFSLKKEFNARFVRRTNKAISLAFALDGNGRQLVTPRSSMGHVLWATWRGADGSHESILDAASIPTIAARLMKRDLFVPHAGIRTLSSRSSQFDPVSYHNGSIWPHDTAITAAGLENFGYTNDARSVRSALKHAYEHYKTPIELFGFTRGKFREYTHPGGTGGACRVQAWSAAALLSSTD
jgi:glycogen debranching enzyme